MRREEVEKGKCEIGKKRFFLREPGVARRKDEVPRNELYTPRGEKLWSRVTLANFKET